ncbi:MAG TPA: DUF952 domain-containing protein [Kofleriaceae bacterium]|jgi:uncharacterized protein (DUF952 family)|nr:DUF952 domain-containing protein [Kofleriaceae bacterium]
MAIVLHITTRPAWDAALAAGSYRPASLAHEGFIHGSTPAQAAATAGHYFRGRTDLVLLCIDEARVTAEIRYEPPEPPATEAAGPTVDPARAAEIFPHIYSLDEQDVVPHREPVRAAEIFPHIYGPLDLTAVVRVVAFPCNPDGSFTLPLDAAG